MFDDSFRRIATAGLDALVHDHLLRDAVGRAASALAGRGEIDAAQDTAELARFLSSVDPLDAPQAAGAQRLLIALQPQWAAVAAEDEILEDQAAEVPAYA